MLIDMHAHTSGISLCCHMGTEIILNNAKLVGIDGIILTNHYQESYLSNISFNDWKKKYVEEYKKTKEIGQKYGIQVFFGTEITMSFDTSIHLLIYGISEKDIVKLPQLFNFSQKELFALCQKNNWLLIQAHPYRNGTTPLDPKYLHGVEINCHPKYGNAFTQNLIEFAKKNHLLLTCGCDYHGDVDYRPYGGIEFPNKTKCINDIVDFLKENSAKIIMEQEIPNREIKKIIF